MSNIGQLRERISIQKFTEVQDNAHGTMKSWETILQVFAEITDVNGYTTFDTQQINEKITHKIRIRYQPYISSENWIRFDGRRFRIRNIRNIKERDRFLILLCEEVFYALDYFEVSENAVGDPLQYQLDDVVNIIIMQNEIARDPVTFLQLTDAFLFIRDDA